MPPMGPATVMYKVGLVDLPDLGEPVGVEVAPTIEITATGPSDPFITAVPTAVITGTTIKPRVYAQLPPGDTVAGPTVVTMWEPYSNLAPSTDTDTVRDKDTVVTAVAPTVVSFGDFYFI